MYLFIRGGIVVVNVLLLLYMSYPFTNRVEIGSEGEGVSREDLKM